MTTTTASHTETTEQTATVGSLLEVVGSDTLVPLLDGRSVPYANLDIAASAPALRAVADRVAETLPLYASVHRGAGYLSQVSTALYEASRQTIASFVNARPDDVTIITRNSTDSLNLLAGCVPTDGPHAGRVLVLDIEHHANLLSWHRARGGVTILPGAESVAQTLTDLRAELARRPYALLALTGASNVTGESLPLADVVEIAHAAGARIAIDGAQLVPHRGADLTESGVDYLAFSGHKTYAPFGAGILVGPRDWLDDGVPYLAGGGAVRNVTADEVTWAPAPARHEAGSPNVIGAIALAAACEALAALDQAEVDQHEDALRTQLVTGLAEIDGIEIVRAWADATHPVGVVTFSVVGHDPGFVAAYLSAEHGIGVRDGRFCAHPLLARLGFNNGAIRASVGVGTTSEEVDRLLVALQQFVTAGPRAEYGIEGGCWIVANDPRPLPDVTGLSGLIATAAVANASVAGGCGPTS